MRKVGDKIVVNRCVGTITEVIDAGVYWVNFGEAGNFVVLESEIEYTV